MKSPSLHIRKKVIALLVSMTALWIFAAVVTLREGMNLLFVSTLDTGVGRPTEALVDALQQERKLSVVVLGGGGGRDALVASRTRTDEALATWRSHIADTNLDLAASQQLKDSINNASNQLNRLGEYRDQINKSTVDRVTAVGVFTTMIDAGFRVYGSISSFDDQEIAKQSRTLISMSRAREVLSQEDALLSGALAAGTLTAQDLTEFTKLVGAQRFLYASTSPELPAQDLLLYQEAASGPAMTKLRDAEDTMLQKATPGAAPPFTDATWRETIDPAVKEMREVELAAADHTIELATPAAIGVIIRLALAGGLGLLAVIFAVIISITTARRLVFQLEKLREAARDLAENRLPKVVNRLSMGQEVDVAAEAPPLSFGNDEIGQVGQAFNAVQETAIRAAVQQADLRRGVRDVFLSLARRTQNLVHKQLGMLDVMERRAGPEELEELFRIDHLATRMRRSAENLIVLSGATAGRTWRRPVPMIDIVRGAQGEVEEYTRVNLLPVDAAALAGRAVGDVIHLLAELIENAVSYSPPYTDINVSGQAVANGFVVEIEDRGLGMSDADLEVANAQLADPPDFSIADTSRLGHYVVAKLAQRHGIKVHLRHSPYGGTAAIVLIPADLVVKASDGPVPERLVDLTPPAPVSFRRHDVLSLPATPAVSPPLPVREEAPVPQLPMRTAEPGPSTVDEADPAEEATTTPSGLPWRVRQASLAPQLKDETVSPAEEEPEELPARDPELVRRMMRSYQHGTQQGRHEATNEAGSPQHLSMNHFGDRQEG